MKIKKEYPVKTYYTPKEVDDIMGFNRIPYHNLSYIHITKALSKLPIPIVNKVLKECYFISYSGMTLGHCLPSFLTKNKTIIYISWYYVKRAKEKNIEHTILHEIAHWFLNHSASISPNSPFDSPVAETNKKENEADRQAEKWLQEYWSHRQNE
jgi:hypothetical protein